MIVTVTPNPCIDLTMGLDQIARGEVQRATSVLVEPSGKGVNVAIALHAAGHAATAVLPVGSRFGSQLRSMLDDEGVPHVAVPVSTPVRVNVTVLEGEGTTTKINDPGSALSAQESDAIVRASLASSHDGDWIAWCGSLPAPDRGAWFARGVAAARDAGRNVAVDTSGGVLERVLTNASEHLPHVVKPNREELAELIGRDLPTMGAVVGAARELIDSGVETVLVSLGADGAVLVDADGAVWGRAPVRAVVNTAGAGDAMLAGFLATPDATAPDRLRTALAFAATAVGRPGTLLAGGVDVNTPAVLSEIEPNREL